MADTISTADAVAANRTLWDAYGVLSWLPDLPRWAEIVAAPRA